MERKFKDLTGMKFGRLTVIAQTVNNKHGHIMWLCKCECGNEVVVGSSQLTRKTKNTRSCGCLHREIIKKERKENIVGRKYGRLTVIKSIGTINHNSKWLCKCECGNETIATGYQLTSGSKNSCGCLRKESITTHGKYKTRLYRIYKGMKRRCYAQNSADYKNYGEQGVTVCQEWLTNFLNFYHWAVENGYKENLSIDRINPYKNYEPSNCRWIPLSEQVYTRRCCFDKKEMGNS